MTDLQPVKLQFPEHMKLFDSVQLGVRNGHCGCMPWRYFRESP